MKQLNLLRVIRLSRDAARCASGIAFLCIVVACSYGQQTETAETHYNLGVTFYEMGDLNGAVAEYQAALRLNPNHVHAHINLCNVLYAKDDLNGAVAECQAALRLDPNLAEAHHTLGLALYDKDDLNGAIVEYRAAIRLNPNEPLAHSDL